MMEYSHDCRQLRIDLIKRKIYQFCMFLESARYNTIDNSYLATISKQRPISQSATESSSTVRSIVYTWPVTEQMIDSVKPLKLYHYSHLYEAHWVIKHFKKPATSSIE